MSYRLTELVNALNAALNYPAITYEDVSVYLDMCVSELNTTLHTSMKPFSEYVKRSSERALAENPLVQIANDPSGSEAAVDCVSDAISEVSDGWHYWSERTSRPDLYGKFVRFASGEPAETRMRLFGYYKASDKPAEMYEAHVYSPTLCLWVRSAGFGDVDVTEFLTADWILMFVVPYVCFKYAARDGGVASTFAEEMEQGFQQLQETYDVPASVDLASVKGFPAYRDDVESLEKAGVKSLEGVRCGTRAIYEYMKHPRGTNARYGSLYDAGGWGL